jgi:hypothetical protein
MDIRKDPKDHSASTAADKTAAPLRKDAAAGPSMAQPVLTPASKPPAAVKASPVAKKANAGAAKKRVKSVFDDLYEESKPATARPESSKPLATAVPIAPSVKISEATERRMAAGLSALYAADTSAPKKPTVAGAPSPATPSTPPADVAQPAKLQAAVSKAKKERAARLLSALYDDSPDAAVRSKPAESGVTGPTSTSPDAHQKVPQQPDTSVSWATRKSMAAALSRLQEANTEPAAFSRANGSLEAAVLSALAAKSDDLAVFMSADRTKLQADAAARGGLAAGPATKRSAVSVPQMPYVGLHAYSDEHAVLKVFPEFIRNMQDEPLIAFAKPKSDSKKPDRLTEADLERVKEITLHVFTFEGRRKGEGVAEYAARAEAFYAELLNKADTVSFVRRSFYYTTLFRLFSYVRESKVKFIDDILRTTSSLAMYPHYLAVLSLRSSDTRSRETALRFLRANQAVCVGQHAAGGRAETVPTVPPWWRENLAASPIGELPKDFEESMLQYRAMDGNNSVTFAPDLALGSALELARCQFLAANFENLNIARRLLVEHEISPAPQLDTKSSELDATFRMLPNQIITEAEQKLAAIDAHSRIAKRYGKERTVLEMALRQAEHMDSESKVGGDLYSEVAYLVWNDSALRQLNSQMGKTPSLQTLRQALEAEKVADELLASEPATPVQTTAKSPRKRTPRGKKGKSAAAAGAPAASGWQMQAGPSVGQKQVGAANTALLASPTEAVFAPPIDILSLLQKDKYTSRAILNRFNQVFSGMEKGEGWAPDVGGFQLLTRLSAPDLQTLLGFVSPLSLSQYARVRAGEHFDPKYSSRAYSLLWHMRKHFNSGPERLAALKLPADAPDRAITAEEYIHNALVLGAEPEAGVTRKTSSADASVSLLKKKYAGSFAFFDPNNLVVTHGVDPF